MTIKDGSIDPKIGLLRDISAIITSVLDLDQLLGLIIDTATRIMDAKASSLLLVDEERKKLRFFISTGEKKEKLKEYDLELGEGIAGWVAENGKPLLIEDVKNDERWNSKIGKALDFDVKSMACYPMKVQKRVIGVIEIINRKDGKPFRKRDMDILSAFTELVTNAIEKARRYRNVSKENIFLKKKFEKSYQIIGKSKAVKDVISDALKVADSKANTLLTGESGTGKELMARLVHNNSPRKRGPFVTVSCGALPETLLERELFGHEKGAFTGADKMKIGLFEAADGGTILLDEIGEMSQTMQVKLLRVLQESSFFRIGGTSSIQVDVRIIAATNQDLTTKVKEGSFREDLFYRLHVVSIKLPPLRDRIGDIPILIDHFLERHTEEYNSIKPTITKEAMERMVNYHWPGNIRQLENAVERAVVMGNGKEINSDDLPIDITRRELDIVKVGSTLKEAQERFKKEFLAKTLDYTNGNRTKAASVLGIQRTYLSRLLKELNVPGGRRRIMQSEVE